MLNTEGKRGGGGGGVLNYQSSLPSLLTINSAFMHGEGPGKRKLGDDDVNIEDFEGDSKKVCFGPVIDETSRS